MPTQMAVAAVAELFANWIPPLASETLLRLTRLACKSCEEDGVNLSHRCWLPGVVPPPKTASG